MIAWEFGAADLAGLRFAHSPMAELVASVFALRGGGAGWVRPDWSARVTAGLRSLPTFRAVLCGPRGHAPDFLTPVPAVARPSLDDELAVIAATPLDQVVEQVTAGWVGSAPPPVARFVSAPEVALAVLIAEIREYHATAIAPLWSRLRAAAEAEIATRVRVAAERSPRTMVSGLHPMLGWDGSALLLKYLDKSGEWSAAGLEMTLLPTAFAGPHLYAMTGSTTPDPRPASPGPRPQAGSTTPDPRPVSTGPRPQAGSAGGRALWYAPAGYGNLWSPPPPPAAALSALLGPTRAAVLTLLTTPASTGEVAALLNLAPATASHHLTTLRDAGLITPERTGRRLRYHRTHLGNQLTAG
ncbi:transcriptional regulator [Actinoplanes ianthinogenes]|uniref:Transcriptional regulator n=1 Tax=Actinoplanes ianthinogenes TaxID=122358 RepID=A0ABM7LJW6_9ACTN|nr:helix-turn-helix domain-containing protein [Actinoplanes ianthinogenes]BCJ39560.1 transcriptional regulator [Actinoplanes ianthinogenes]GGR59121.1 transcriptional regulator [Actinoplanes ianthinogenes]